MSCKHHRNNCSDPTKTIFFRRLFVHFLTSALTINNETKSILIS
jgi:hypothetical protein